jgi:hypothetical protein
MAGRGLQTTGSQRGSRVQMVARRHESPEGPWDGSAAAEGLVEWQRAGRTVAAKPVVKKRAMQSQAAPEWQATNTSTALPRKRAETRQVHARCRSGRWVPPLELRTVGVSGSRRAGGALSRTRERCLAPGNVDGPWSELPWHPSDGSLDRGYWTQYYLRQGSTDSCRSSGPAVMLQRGGSKSNLSHEAMAAVPVGRPACSRGAPATTLLPYAVSWRVLGGLLSPEALTPRTVELQESCNSGPLGKIGDAPMTKT